MGVSVSVGGYGVQTDQYVSCAACNKLNDYGMTFCEKCGEALEDENGIQENYFKDPGMNFIS